ncbi:MAG: transporter substrate-binding domain-containing protein [Clostridia bacterium]|nr:transporter substrate-binding domain-containing protein [Clostridia bacterium]
MNKILKTLGMLLLVVILGCAVMYVVLELSNRNTNDEKVYEELEIYTLSGPTGFAVSKLAESKDYKLIVQDAPDKVSAALIKGDAMFATIPSNLAAILNKKTGGKIKILSVISEGNLYVMSTNPDIKSVDDLKGKTVTLSGAGATPEVIARDLLGSDVTLDFKSEHAECVAMLKSGKAETIILPEPYVTICKKQVPEVQVAVDLAKAYEDKHGDLLPMSVLVFNSDYLSFETADEILDDFGNDGNVETLPYVTGEDRISKLLNDVKESIHFANSNPQDAAKIIEDNGIIGLVGVAESSIPGCKLKFKAASDSKELITKYFEIINGIYPDLIGGAVPSEEIYY